MYYWFMGKELFLKYGSYIENLILLASIIIFFAYIKSFFIFDFPRSSYENIYIKLNLVIKKEFL